MLVIVFDEPHPIGSICRKPCPYCEASGRSDDGTVRIDAEQPRVEAPPMKIVREATKEEWLECVRRDFPEVTPNHPGLDLRGFGRTYFYEVQTD